MKALFIDVQRPIESRLLDPATTEAVGDAVITRSARLPKPRREFTLKSWDTLLATQAELIRNGIHASRITSVFWFDGDKYAEIEERIFIGEGNGSQLEFPLPYNNVFPSSWKIYVNETLNTGWTMRKDSGVIVFSSAPSGRISGLGKHKFRVVMVDESDSILSESQIYSSDQGQVYELAPITLLEVEGVNVA
jgi:hypothetical protein